MNTEFQKAKQLYLSGLLFDCLKICETILTERPDHADALNLVGMLCYRGGDALAACDYFSQAIKADPKHAEALGNLALCYKGQGRVEESLGVYEQALRLDPNDAQVHYNYGLALWALGRHDHAAESLSRAAQLAPLLGDVFNALGQVRLEKGDVELAVLAFKSALTAHPATKPPYLNMAKALTAGNAFAEAVKVLQLGVSVHGIHAMGRELAQAYQHSGDLFQAEQTLTLFLSEDPANTDVWEELAMMQFSQCRFTQALDSLRTVVELDESRARAHMQIYSIAQILELPDLALDHQARALAHTRLFSDVGTPDRPSVLILKAPGDWQINTPTDFIIRTQDWSVVHHYFIDEKQPLSLDIPEADVIFSAVAEPDRAAGALAACTKIAHFLGAPVINNPERMAHARRDQVALALKDLPHTIIPGTHRIAADNAEGHINRLLDDGGLTLPLLLRPAGTHAGHGMELLETREAVAQSLTDLVGQDLYALSFVDYSGKDGQFRKYRVVVVDGQPFPFHMGLSTHWMVHYANARPIDRDQMDREEEQFLAHFDQIFSSELQADLSAMAKILGLDFFAVDCGIHQDGRLVLFEVDAGAIIHTLDNPDLYPYKHTYVPRIFDAVKRMIESRIGHDQSA